MWTDVQPHQKEHSLPSVPLSPNPTNKPIVLIIRMCPRRTQAYNYFIYLLQHVMLYVNVYPQRTVMLILRNKYFGMLVVSFCRVVLRKLSFLTLSRLLPLLGLIWGCCVFFSPLEFHGVRLIQTVY
jgi:hypothetical protein